MLKSKFCHSYDMTRWKLPQSPNIAQRVAGIVKPQTPLKNRLDIAQSKMQGQISRLDLVHEDFGILRPGQRASSKKKLIL